MYCSRCGTNNREGSKFCNNCGGPLTPSDITCPSCGIVNPSKNVFCNNCGARLMPRAAARPEPKPMTPPVKGLSLPTKTPPFLPIQPPAPTGDEGGEKGAEEAGARESGARESGARGSGERPSGSPEMGDAHAAETPFPGGVPDWLAQLRAAPPVEEEAESAPISEDVPSWIRQLQSIKPEESASEPTPSQEETTGPVPAPDDMPSWVRKLESLKPQEPAKPAPSEEPPVEQAPVSEETPTWIRQLQAIQAEEKTAPSAEEVPAQSSPFSDDTPSWIRQLQSLKPEEPAAEPGRSTEELPTELTEPTESSGLPAWLQQATESTWPPQEETSPTAEVTKEQPPVVPSFSLEGKGGESEVVGAVDQSGLPDWLQDLRPEEPAAPQAPAEGQPAAQEPSAPGGSGLPDWLMAGITGEQQRNLAGLPDWLRTAMPLQKPQEAPSETSLAEPPAPPVSGAPAKAAAIEPNEPQTPAADADLAVEPMDSGTPLAGLRGVIPLAVAVAEPHMTVERPASGAGIEKDDGARIFEAILTEAPMEAEPLVAARRRAKAQTMRPVIYLLLALAVIIPFFFPRGVAQTMLQISRTPAADLYDLIQTLPAGATALVAFDYDAGTKGELDLIAAALVRHLMERRIKIVALSSYETGPQIAKKILADAAESTQDYHYGSEYVNVGYIPGHEAGLANLAVGGLPATKDYDQGRDVRQYPVAQNIKSANDVALIVELAGSEESLKWWMEQVQPRTPTRIVAAVSAAVEPKARVYFRSKQLSGMVSGLIGAAQYEILSNQPGQALTSINAQSAAQVLLILIVLSGNIVYWVSRVGQRGRPRARPEKAT